MKVLVTGSEGSLAQWVIAQLVKDGHEVIGVDHMQRHGPVTRNRSYNFRRLDLCDTASLEILRSVASDVNVVIQAAALVYGAFGLRYYASDILMKDLQVQANMLEFAKDLRNLKRFVYLSSSMVYERSDALPYTECQTENILVPHTDYGLSKLVGERMVEAYGLNLPYTIWRPFNIVNPYEMAEDEVGMAHVFADFIDMLLVKKMNPMPIIGGGFQVRCFSWVEDIAKSVARASLLPETCNKTFNIGNSERVTMRDLARLIFRKGQERGIINPRLKLEFAPTVGLKNDVYDRIPDITLAKETFGFEPSLSLSEAMDACMDIRGF